MVKVLFVCMGNICRSPTAHGVFRDLVISQGLVDAIKIDSAGTHAYHVGEGADSRAQQTAKSRGVDLSDLRARKVEVNDFETFDYVLAMDRDNYNGMMQICPANLKDRIHLFLDFAEEETEAEVPDPYYGGVQGFDHVFDLVEAASKGLLAEIKQSKLS